MLNRSVSLIFFVFLFSYAAAHPSDSLTVKSPSPASTWADSILQTLTLEQKIKQLSLIKFGVKDSSNIVKFAKEGFGGVYFQQGNPSQQINFTNQFQMHTQIPLLITMSGNRGVGEWLDRTLVFPQLFTLEAIQNDSLLIKSGKKAHEHYKLIGVNGLIQNEFENLGESLEGQVHARSLDLLEEKNIDNIQRASQYLDALQENDLLLLNAKFLKQEEEILGWIKNPNFLILLEDGENTIERIVEKLEADSTFQNEITERTKQVLETKFQLGLHNFKPIETTKAIQKLDDPIAQDLKDQLFEEAITVLTNEDELIPFQKLDSVQFASLSLSNELPQTFQSYLDEYAAFEHFQIPVNGNETDQFRDVFKNLREKDIIILSIHEVFQSKDDQEALRLDIQAWIKKLRENSTVILAWFDEPQTIGSFANEKHLICAYQHDISAEKALPQLLFGAIEAKGKLPYSIAPDLPKGYGLNTQNLQRFGYALPERVGLNSTIFSKIDSLAQLAIEGDATPGCQVFIAKNGKILLNKSYGFHTYQNKNQVTNSSLYDIASITKVVATLPTIMHLEDQKRLNLNERLRTYLPETVGTNKANMVLKDILTHQAGLMSFIPHWTKVMDGKNYDSAQIAFRKSEAYPLEIVAGLYADKEMEKRIWQRTLDSRFTIRSKRGGMHRYFYSDLGFYIMQELVERLLEEPLEDFTSRYFYKPLGLQTMTFLPRYKFPTNRIVPTEMDVSFRKGLVHGSVHDPGAALKGGVAGHAGIFSNAYDVAVMMQIHLQGGYYGGKQFFQPNTINHFNKRPYAFNDNRRGIGWDKPVLDKQGGPTSNYCSDQTFGHTGFTGTAAWADPAHDLVYVFLSNRVHPYAGNRGLIRGGYRTRIQDIIYEAMNEGNL